MYAGLSLIEIATHTKGYTMTRTARVSVAAVYATCPVCGSEEVAGADGSMLILVNQEQTLGCLDCGAELQLPKKHRD